MSLPLVVTPLTRLMAKSANQSTTCGDFQMDFLRCASTVGMTRAKYDCLKELEDFRECLYREKQIERTDIMEAERKRQKRAGIRPCGIDILPSN